MKGALILSGSWRGRDAAAYLLDGQLEDFICAPPKGVPSPGTVLSGKIARPVKGLGGFFVDLPGNQRGFIRQTKGISAGASLPVQVTGFAREGKAIPITTKIAYKGQFVVITPDAPGRNISRAITDPDRRTDLESALAKIDLPEGCGMVVRSASAESPVQPILDEAQYLVSRHQAFLDGENSDPTPEDLLLATWPDARRAAPDETFEAYEIEDLLSDALGPVTKLSGGGSIAIEPTRALIAVDVNTGSDTSPAAGLKATLDAVRDLPRLLRLRGLGGQVILDPAPFPKKDRRTVENSIKAAFAKDPISTTLAGWTPLGHFELQRRHARLPVLEPDQ